MAMAAAGRSSRERRGIGAGLDDGDAIGGDAVVGEPRGGRAAGDDDGADGGERAAFADLRATAASAGSIPVSAASG